MRVKIIPLKLPLLLLLIYLAVSRGDTYHEKSSYHGDVVTSNGPECAAIGMDILKNHNGTAVDATIAVLFCEGVVVSSATGIGGGLIATIYEKTSGTVETIVARERAPIASTYDMFINMTEVQGILTVGVPAALKGYAEIHKKYGRTPWNVLIQPTIDLCRSGHKISKYLSLSMQLRPVRSAIFSSPSLREIFVDANTGDLKKVGDLVKREKLAETLEIIAKEGVDSMYAANGTIAMRLVQEFQELGGIITMEDFTSYETTWQKPFTTTRGNYTLNTVPLPASGMILSLILNILNGYEPSMSAPYLHKMVESFKYAYAKRSYLGDEIYNQTFLNQFSDMKIADDIRQLITKDNNRTFNDTTHYGAEYALKEDHGTIHVSVLTRNGDAVAVTSSINAYFGSRVYSRSTGIILNNQMADFSTPGMLNIHKLPPTPANFIKPGKRPMSSMCPSILIDNKNGDAVFIVGAAGGTKIPTTVAYIFARHIWMNESLKDAVLAKRIHHQLSPMKIVLEEGFDEMLAAELKTFGHKVVFSSPPFVTTVTAISRISGHIEAVSDSLESGSVEID